MRACKRLQISLRICLSKLQGFRDSLDVLRPSLQETRQVFEKLHTYIGKNIKNLVEGPDEDHVLRLHKNRVYYVRESLMRKATNVSQPAIFTSNA